MPIPDLAGKPGIYHVHSVHGGGTYFPDEPSVLEFYAGRGWEPADPPLEDDEEIAEEPVSEEPEDEVSPESPAEDTSKTEDEGEVTGG